MIAIVHCSSSFDESSPASMKTARRALMMKYVNEASPKDSERFVKTGPPEVVSAMRQTVRNLVGTLPSSYFDVKISSAADSLAQLFFTVAITGYLFRNAQTRLELQIALGAGSQAPGGSSSSSSSNYDDHIPSAMSGMGYQNGSSNSSTSNSKGLDGTTDDYSGAAAEGEHHDSTGLSPGRILCRSIDGTMSAASRDGESRDGEYAPGVQMRNVEGEILRWHHTHGVERMEASKYIQQLEQQVKELRDELASAKSLLRLTGPDDHKAGQLLNEPPSWVDAQTLQQAISAGSSALPSLLSLANSSSRLTSAAAASATVACSASHSGELLTFIRDLPGEHIQELTAEVSPEVIDAMDLFIARLMGTEDVHQLRTMTSQFDSNELSKVLFWLLVVGTSLRQTREDRRIVGKLCVAFICAYLLKYEICVHWN
ncbi:hypothetical protein CEUSTIGMA_g2023.t1 [Chlamydomonas eustigma]|uniref:Uncharacterized protein n=1 Tax=Chlamydomonas eustigma TaxID=1157962 RepID=A0A250WUR2_9CHLO|nr:hypothetical protein CEUSTIGMA_g2023.t1 [Chlamydomonas eustigma]|eukprot:GAX74574.1 hypothetical protein CEUSTIGMA_g2023.t1 [Chlamydomonas eustigma]